MPGVVGFYTSSHKGNTESSETCTPENSGTCTPENNETCSTPENGGTCTPENSNGRENCTLASDEALAEEERPFCKEEPDEEESDDEEGWINPENFDEACDEMGGALQELAVGVAVGCVTTDFAMQVHLYLYVCDKLCVCICA